MFRNAATKIAHNSTLPSLAAANKDLKTLQDLIYTEKAVLISLQKLSVDFGKAGEALRAWGLGEGDDLGDTLSAATTLLTLVADSFSNYATHEHAIRDTMKSVRTREEALDEMKRKRKALVGKADAAEKKLSRMSPEHKNLGMQTDTLNRLRDEIKEMDSEIMTEEAALGDYKRSTTRRWMGLKFGGLLECCEKGTIAAEYGKLIIGEIPEEITQPGMARPYYTKQGKVDSLVQEAQRCISEVQFTSMPSSDVPHIPHQPTGEPGASPTRAAWPPASGHNATPSQGAPDHLGLGSGHFMDGTDFSGNASASAPPPSEPSYPQPTQTTDDFGVNMNTQGSNGVSSGGRFATFPVKGRNGGVSLRDEGPRPLEGEPSFASSVAEALRFSNSIDPVPAYNAAPTQYAPPPGPPPGAANPWADNRVSVAGSEDAYLAYAQDGDESGEHRVRFGKTTDVDEEIARREREQHQQSQLPPLDMPPRMPVAEPAPSSTSSSPKMGPKRVPPPQFSPEEDERELNAAAAREVSREMDALNFSPPAPQPPSPLAPPSAPFAHDNPASNLTSAQSYAQAHKNSPASDYGAMTLAQSYAQEHKHSGSHGSSFGRSTSPAGPRGPLPAPTPGNTGHSPSPSYSSEAPTLPAHQPSSPITPRLSLNFSSQPPPAISLPSEPPLSPGASLSGSGPPGGGTPFRTPPEYPRTLGPYNKSSSSVNSQGPRTISAAAFRRAPKMGSTDTAESPQLGPKKWLPSSPYPAGRAPSASDDAPPAPAGGPQVEQRLPHIQPLNLKKGEEHQEHAMPNPYPPHSDERGVSEGEDEYDYINAYVNDPEPSPGSPLRSDYGRLGNVKVVNAGSPGYENGKFATNLDGNQELR